MSRQRRLNRALRGVSMVEMLVAVVVLSLAILPLMKLFMGTVQGAEENWSKTRANWLAQSLMNEMAKTRWDQLGPAGTVPTLGATIGLDFPGVYDDVDDWVGYTDVVENRFTRTVGVDFVSIVMNEVVSSLLPTDLKRARVTVTWPGGTDVVLTTIFANSAY